MTLGDTVADPPPADAVPPGREAGALVLHAPAQGCTPQQHQEQGQGAAGLMALLPLAAFVQDPCSSL